MKEIEFHFNVPDKLAYSCRLLRKVYRAGHKAVVTAEPALLRELDHLLWIFSPAEFLPHCLDSAAALTRAASPVLLSEKPGSGLADRILINLGQQAPPDFVRFQRFIEVVSGQQDDRLLGRERWKLYKAQGYELKQHDAVASRDAE